MTDNRDDLTVSIYYRVFRNLMKIAGQQIDPATAEVQWDWAQTLDPYGVKESMPKECDQVGREYFARAPGTSVWVSFDDLPDATREALWNRPRPASKPTSPAGLEEFDP
jgi:hypothetical protein